MVVVAQDSKPYRVKHPVRIVSAASLFDGHDAAINIMRRILQSSGAEVIHLGHNRSVREVVDCAVEEDAQGIAISSYQGGHIEYFKYMFDLVRERGAKIRIFGGGGGTILPSEIKELHDYGIDHIYSSDDGRKIGLQGMVNHILQSCDFAAGVAKNGDLRVPRERSHQAIARFITMTETAPERAQKALEAVKERPQRAPVLGVTGTGGAGKSSLVDELVYRFLRDCPTQTLAIISVDPSKRKTGGALLGDRIRMNAVDSSRVYMRSLATRQTNLSLSKHVRDAVALCQATHFDLIIVETSGIGQSDSEIADIADISLYVMTADYGAATQLEKIDMLDFADVVAINKFDKPGSLDALRDVGKQWQRNHQEWETPLDDLPVLGTIASRFADPGVDQLYFVLMSALAAKTGGALSSNLSKPAAKKVRKPLIPSERSRYLAEIVESSRAYDKFVDEQAALASELYRIAGAVLAMTARAGNPVFVESLRSPAEACAPLLALYEQRVRELAPETRCALQSWPEMVERYGKENLEFTVRGRKTSLALNSTTLSGTVIPKISLPRYRDWGDLIQWLFAENVPGSFPYTAGVFPLKRQGEDPARMFAGEGGPEQTNKRFHYLSKDLSVTRLSTAFDSVTLYGEDPARRLDIYGKVGNSGVSIASVDDAKKLYSGFDLSHPNTSVSMTINGPAPMLLGFFMNAAIDQQCEKYIREQGLSSGVEKKIAELYRGQENLRPRYLGDLPAGNDGLGLALLGVSGDQVVPAEVYLRIKEKTLAQVRGTVQADILKEDQAQNTCIFSTEFALRMMANIQEYFIEHKVRNFYSVSISGYHIAEAGANPLSQLAFTLANAFTYVEYYLARGMALDDFAPNLSFFFSNGMDPEYSVIGRVARRIWAKAIKHKYGGCERSQKLKYHVQTSGRSLHAQEIAFNDIRTTLQALTALYDNCNSLHTNAYDEALTTPTEESVRRALAIQMIINKEHGLSKNENPLQGSFIVEELTNLVEQAVLDEFCRLSERGGTLGAMERMYQRSKIQEESLYYESCKYSGELPIVGVNTFLSPGGSPILVPDEVIRATKAEKEHAISSRDAFIERNRKSSPKVLAALQNAALCGDNTFASLMEACKVCTLGQLSQAFYEVGGKYRRNM